MAAEQDILRQLEAMAKGFGQLNQTMTAMARATGARVDGRTALPGEVDRGKSSRSYKDAEKKAEQLDVAAKKFFKLSNELTGDIKKTRGAWQDLTEAIKTTGGALSGAGAAWTGFGTTFNMMKQDAERIAAGMGRYESTIAKTTKSQSMLYAKQIQLITQLKDYEQAAGLEKLTNALDELTIEAKKELKVWDEATNKMRTDLNFEELANARAALGDVLANVAQNLSTTDFSSVMQLAQADPDKTFGRDGDKNRDAMVKIAAQLQQAGLYLPSRESLNVLDKEGNIKDAKGQAELFSQNNVKEFTAAIAKIVEALDKGATKTDKAVTQLTTPLGKAGAVISTYAGKQALVNKAMDYFLTTAALHKAAKGIKELYSEVTAFNVAGVPATYADTMMASAQMGMNFKDTTAILQENKRVLAIYGPKEFRNSLGQMKDTFAKFGFNMQQGAELIGPTVEAAISSGINIRDPGQLNSFTDSMMNSFSKIAGIVNISAKEFIQLNGQLFKSEGTFDTLMGMDVNRRQAYAQDLIQLRERYVVNGLDLQTAQKLVEIQQQQIRDNVKNKFGESAKMMALAQISGMGSAASMEMYKLSTKGIRTKDEDSRLAQLMGTLNQTVEQNRLAAYGPNGDDASGVSQDLVREQLMPAGALGEMMKKSLEMTGAKEAGAAVTEAEQARAQVLQKGSTTLANFGNVVNTVTSILQSALMAATIGTAVSFTALIIQTRSLMGTFAAFQAKMGMSGMPGMDGKGGGKGGGKFGKFAGAAASLAVIGGLGFSAWSGVNDAEAKEKSGEITPKQATVDKTGMLGMLAGGGTAGLVGAGVGQVLIPIPGVGAVIGGAVGAALGGWLGKTGAEAIAGAVISDTQTPGMPAQLAMATPLPPIAPKIQMPGDAETSALPGSINTSGQTQTLAVKDTKVVDQLVNLANLTQQMVQLLQVISDKNGLVVPQPTAPGVPAQLTPAISVPSVSTFYTGQVARRSS